MYSQKMSRSSYQRSENHKMIEISFFKTIKFIYVSSYELSFICYSRNLYNFRNYQQHSRHAFLPPLPFSPLPQPPFKRPHLIQSILFFLTHSNIYNKNRASKLKTDGLKSRKTKQDNLKKKTSSLFKVFLGSIN